MSKIVSIHSFRGGTGKSNTTANISTLLAMRGYRVGVVDTDIQSPGIHVLFGMQEEEMKHALNDYLWGNCEIHECAYNVTERQNANISGEIYLIPSSIKTNQIVRILREGYEVSLLNEGFHDLIDEFDLDYLVIDTHPGLNEETLLSIAISNNLILILRPDNQDYQGTSVTVGVARKLDIPNLNIVVNKVPAVYDVNEVRRKVESAYKSRVVAIVPHSDEMMALASSGIFALHYPDHPAVIELNKIADVLED